MDSFTRRLLETLARAIMRRKTEWHGKEKGGGKWGLTGW